MILIFTVLVLLGKIQFSNAGFEDIFVSFITDVTPTLFAPTRLSLHLCLDKEETISLARELSRSHLMHGIYNDFEQDYKRLYDAYEHRNLYVLDLNCDYAFRVLEQANSSGMFVAPTKWLLLRDRWSAFDEFAVDLYNSTIDDSVIELFEDFTAYPDSDVVLATRLSSKFLELRSIYRPSPYRNVTVENRGNWTLGMGLNMTNNHVASRRRKNLHLSPLRICLVLTDFDSLNHLTDFVNEDIDTITKVSYPWLHHIANRINATITLTASPSWGYQDKNGTWGGMMGMLHRKEVDIGGTACYITADRIDIVKFINLYTITTNIFVLPFQRSVWIAIGVLHLLVYGLLYLSTNWEHYRDGSTEYWQKLNPAKPTLGENFLVILGAVAQQGFSFEPCRVPSRIVTLMLLIAALSLYTSYTANIVALLQASTDSIKTPEDLLKSPLKLGAHDVVYLKHNFQAFEDPIRRALVDQKIDKNSWMTHKEGVRRIKDELFAFHGDQGLIYKLMQETYKEDEKCGFSELNILDATYPLMAIQTQSPYLELVKNTALLLWETGLKFADERRWYTEEPKCKGQTGFISIGFTECYFALVIMGYGILLALLMLLCEYLWYSWYKSGKTCQVAQLQPVEFVD